MIELTVKTATVYQPLTISTKIFMIDVLRGCKYVSAPDLFNLKLCDGDIWGTKVDSSFTKEDWDNRLSCQ